MCHSHRCDHRRFFVVLLLAVDGTLGISESVTSQAKGVKTRHLQTSLQAGSEAGSTSPQDIALARHTSPHVKQLLRKESSADGDPYGVSSGKWADAETSASNWMDAPAWAPHASMPAMPANCALSVTQDSAGTSDYGTLQHSCARCPPHHNCTDENKQLPTGITWDISPQLKDHNAFAVEFFANWTNIGQIGCSSCGEIGLAQKFKMHFATNAGADVADYLQAGQSLHFPGWMGGEVAGGPTVWGPDAGYPGKHVFEIDDTEDPSTSNDCNEANPAGRWLALPGDKHAGESFKCERICKSTHPCNCGRNTGMRCTADITMASSQVFKYKVEMVESSANITYDGNTYMGTEWQVTAEDLTQASPVKTVGRVLLAGNSATYGIEDVSASHEHLGCVPCDLFYESTVIVGPFITTPANEHQVLKATAHPPALGEETCQNYRISAIQGLAIKHETGPGLWPSFQVDEELFTCPAT